MKNVSVVHNIDVSITQGVKFLWIFFLILSNDKRSINKNCTLKYTNGFNLLLTFFKSFNFKYLYVSFSNWNKEQLMYSLVNFLISLYNITFTNNFLKHFYFNFKKLFNVVSIFFIPNFVFKKFDFIYINVAKSHLRDRELFLGRNFFFYYGKKNVKFLFYNFFFFKHYINSYCFAKYFSLLNVYFFFFNNLFYNNYRLFFILRDNITFATQWWENPKKFFITVSSISKKYDNSYNNKATFFFWSSVSFLNYLNLPKHLRLSLNIKFVMIKHLRRILLLLNVDQLLFFFKTYVSSLNVLYFTVNSPINEIFINPSNGELVFDILVKIDNDVSFEQFMEKYKDYTQELLGIDTLSNFVNKWAFLLEEFKSSLKPVKFYQDVKLNEKVFLRYNFTCELLFFFRKKFLALKQKKAQSISKRRVKRIIKIAKRRFWIF